MTANNMTVTPNASNSDFEIFLVTAPGHEAVLAAEARTKGFKNPTPSAGGVTIKGNWSDVWRANLELRGAGRVIVRLGDFRVIHLSQLDKRARKFNWAETLRPDVPFRVNVTCKRSKIYHSDAATERIERAISEELGAPASPEAQVLVRARIENDLCIIGIDTSGELLHKRGHKEAVNAAPMRETMASLFLRQCGYTGTEPVVDPMCGSGTFIIEAAEIAANLNPGRSRHFAFEKLATFNSSAWEKMRSSQARATPALRFTGSDNDAGAIRISRANAERAGILDLTDFQERAVEDLKAPEGPPGLVIVNPPYGTRIGDKTRLNALYRTLGQTLQTRFKGWRVGLITSEASLAKSCGLPFAPASAPVSHGGLRVNLFLTGVLK